MITIQRTFNQNNGGNCGKKGPFGCSKEQLVFIRIFINLINHLLIIWLLSDKSIVTC